MNRSIALPGLALVAIVALAACTSASAGAPAGQQPSPSAPATSVATPVATPSATPVRATPSPVPTASDPIETPSDEPIIVDLETATGQDVSIEIIDDGHHVVAARSGHPGEGLSVEFGTLVAKNLDPRTIELTWSDTPGDAELGLYVSENLGVVLVIRPERPEGDAIAFDRVVVVEFDQPVDATGLLLGVQEGLDTAG